MSTTDYTSRCLGTFVFCLKSKSFGGDSLGVSLSLCGGWGTGGGESRGYAS